MYWGEGGNGETACPHVNSPTKSYASIVATMVPPSSDLQKRKRSMLFWIFRLWKPLL